MNVALAVALAAGEGIDPSLANAAGWAVGLGGLVLVIAWMAYLYR